MQELNLRLGQAVALTYAQTDENFKRLKTAIDALEVAVAGAGLGTVTSVGLTLPNIFTVTNSPVTTTGSLTATLASQSANRIFASPSGSAGTPTFRSLVSEDINFAIPVTKGGTGLSTIATIDQVLASNGTGYEGRTISVVPFSGLTLTQGTGSIVFGLNPSLINITSLGGVLTVAQGGTGLSAPPANGTLLIGNGVAYTNTTLTAGSGISITNGAGSIQISTSGVVTQVGGLGDFITKFSSLANDTIINSIIYDTGARIGINTAIPQYELDVFPLTGGGADSSLRVRTNTVGFRANLRLEDGGNTTTFRSDGFLQSNATFLIQNNLRIFPTGNVQVSKGFALNGLVYWNTASNYTFASNEQYGVILGPTSPNTMTVTLPTAPMDGQEICVLVEENKTLTVDSGVALRNIYGQAATPATSVTLAISLNTHGSVYIFKFLAAGNGGVGGGAWYLTGY
jgi:hypothetical protein